VRDVYITSRAKTVCNKTSLIRAAVLIQYHHVTDNTETQTSAHSKYRASIVSRE